jgi:hypothetical protein
MSLAYGDDIAKYDLTVIANPILIDPPSCNGYCDGKAWVIVYGGNLPYTYLWNTGSTIDTIFNICAGTYEVTMLSKKELGAYNILPIEIKDILVATYVG